MPEMVKHMMTFIGLIGFSADWIESREQYTAPLGELIVRAGLDNPKNKLDN